MTDVNNTSTTGGNINSGKGLSSTDFLNNSPQNSGGYMMPPGLFRALYRTSTPITPKISNAATDPKASTTTKTPPQREIKSLLQPAILGKLTPAVLQPQNLDKVVDPKTLNSVRLRTPAQKAAPQTTVEIKPIAASSDVLEKIDKKTEIGLPPAPTRAKKEEVTSKAEAEETKTKSSTEIDKKYGFSDKTLDAISSSVPGSAAAAIAKQGEEKGPKGLLQQISNAVTPSTQGEATTEEEKKEPPRRRRIRLKISTPTTSSGGFGKGLMGAGTGGSVTSMSAQTGGRSPLVFTPFAAPMAGQVIGGPEIGSISTEGLPQIPGGASPQGEQEQRQQTAQEKIQQSLDQAKQKVDQAKRAYERVEKYLPKEYQGLTTQGGTAAEAGAGAAEAGAGAAEAGTGVAQAGTGAVQGATTAGATGGGAAVGATGTGTGVAAGGAAGASALGIAAIILLAALVLALIAVLIYVVASISATNETTKNKNTSGNAKAFFERITPNAGSAIGTTNDASIPLINPSPDTAPFILDASGKILEIRMSYFYQLKSQQEYNTAFLGPNSKSTIAVNNLNLRSRINVPSSYKDSNGNTIDTAPQTGYGLTIIAPNTQPYPSDFSVSNSNVFTWRPAICNDPLSSKVGGIFSSSPDTICRSGYLEKFALIIKFSQPVDPAAFNNRLIISLEGDVNINYYDNATRNLIGPGSVPIDPIYICVDPQNINTTDCANPNNSYNANGQVNNGTIPNPSGGTGTVVPGCPLAINAGEKLVCTSGYDPNRVLPGYGSSPHYANDMVVQTALGQTQTDRSIVSPVNGKIIKVAAESYISKAGVWIQIQDSDNPALIIMMAHIQPGTRTFTVGDVLKKGDILGVQFSGTPNALWNGRHLHFETIYAPNAKGSDPEDYIRKGCNQPLYTCK